MPPALPRIFRTLSLVLLAASALIFASCSSTSKIEGLPQNLPDIALAGSPATPPHNLQPYEYPFDASGNYMTSWAADGEVRAGRPAGATSDDEEQWSKSHHSKVTDSHSSKTKKGTSKPTSSKTTKKKSSSDDDKPKSKSSKKPSKKKSSSDDDDKPSKKSS